MINDLERLKSALHATTPQAPTAIREQAITSAKEYFDLQNQVDSTSDDELAKLKSAFQDTSPKPPASVREQAITTAKGEFDRRFKEKDIEKRHMDKALNFSALHSYIQRLTMQFSRPSLALVGGAFALAIGIVSYQIVVTTYRTTEIPQSLDESVAFLPSTQDVADGYSQYLNSVQVESQQRAESARNKSMAASEQSFSNGGFSSGSANGTGGLMMHFEQPMNLENLLLIDRYTRLDENQSRARFTEFEPNAVKLVTEDPVSTFSIDVDTTSYAYLRAMLNQGILPSKDAIRTEELVNYFPYDYAPPEERDQPFAAHVSLMPAPWNNESLIMHIGIKALEPDVSVASPANLVFLVDTSGSMDQPNKLPLLIRSFKLLLSSLAADDKVAIVAYAGSAGVVLEPTPVSQRSKILASLENLYAGGSTAGGEGIRLAYSLAEQHMSASGVNRVIVATDGDFNVGMTDVDELEEFIITQALKRGVSFSSWVRAG